MRSEVTSGAGTAYPSGAPEFTPGFQWGSCCSIFSFICMFCRSLLVLFLSVNMLSVLLRYTDSDCSFSISKLFLPTKTQICFPLFFKNTEHCNSYCKIIITRTWLKTFLSMTIKPQHASIIINYQPDLVIGDSLIADMIEPILLIPLPLDSAISSTLAFFGFLPLVDFLFSLSVFSAYKKQLSVIEFLGSSRIDILRQ